ncbi:hypothetical protein [Microbacterium sp. T2.11-28]|uniref:hypothetical protein n=1 Tax=Microbacterium sp. T2.11-28 TaxID=3041169 RepID=UPI002477CB49|nr:hypothetical protein [Microbacterium sp. T2.11-28]CAI9393462.1 hypothetical protein MICABA_02455 [Microbacterium sp. T2.11-28]
MTLQTRLLALASATALALSLAACTATTEPAETPTPTTAAAVTEGACADDSGVTLSVDASALPGGSAQEWCRPADEQIAVADLLEDAEVTLQGTDEYPDFICRVNGLPSADEPLGSTEDPEYVETCASTPPGFGYWALWVKPAGGEWAYAEEGVATLRAQPGESIGLLFTLDGAPAAPTS